MDACRDPQGTRAEYLSILMRISSDAHQLGGSMPDDLKQSGYGFSLFLKEFSCLRPGDSAVEFCFFRDESRDSFSSDTAHLASHSI